MTTNKKILLGCIGLPVVLAVVLAVVVGIALVRPPPAARPTHQVLEPVAQLRQESGAVGGDVRPIALVLEDGQFEVAAAAEGESLRVEADFDESMYRLTAEPDADGVVPIRFERSAGALALLKRGWQGAESENRIKVFLPLDTPIALTIKLRRGEGHLDFSGVPLRSLHLDHAMGETRVDFAAPNPVAMDELVVDAKMGAVRLDGLGFARVNKVQVDGKMGEFALDFGDQPGETTAIGMKIRMGEGTVDLAASSRFRYGQTRARMGGLQLASAPPSDLERATGDGALTLDLDVALGEIVVEVRRP